MDQQIIVFEIERRARAAKIRMGELCRRAGIAQSTVSRWKNGTPASLGKIAKLTAQLDLIEQGPEA